MCMCRTFDTTFHIIVSVSILVYVSMYMYMYVHLCRCVCMQHRGCEYVCMGVGLCVMHVCVWVYVYTCVCMGVCVIHVCVWVYLCMGTNPDMHVIKIYGNPF